MAGDGSPSLGKINKGQGPNVDTFNVEKGGKIVDNIVLQNLT